MDFAQGNGELLISLFPLSHTPPTSLSLAHKSFHLEKKPSLQLVEAYISPPPPLPRNAVYVPVLEVCIKSLCTALADFRKPL